MTSSATAASGLKMSSPGPSSAATWTTSLESQYPISSTLNVTNPGPQPFPAAMGRSTLSSGFAEDEEAVKADDTLDTSQPDNGPTSIKEQMLSQSRSAPGPGLSSASPSGCPTTQTTFVPVPVGESVFSKIVSSSTPAVIGKQGSSLVLGTTFNTFQSAPNVFGGPVFGVPATSSSTSLKTVEPPKPAVRISTLASLHRQTCKLYHIFYINYSARDKTIAKSCGSVRALAAPSFSTSQSAPTLNAFAPSFEPSPFRALKSVSLFPPASRASLPPLKMDSPLSRTMDSYVWLYNTCRLAITIIPPTSEASERVSVLDSPVAPLVLARRANISLLGTPTSAFPSSAVPLVEPTIPSASYHFPTFRVNISAMMTSTPHPQPSSGPCIVEISEIPSPIYDAPSSLTSIANGKEPQREPPSPGAKKRL
ncbi:hypothetical protein ACEPAG_4206 [Sanghuangporus baumii]